MNLEIIIKLMNSNDHNMRTYIFDYLLNLFNDKTITVEELHIIISNDKLNTTTKSLNIIHEILWSHTKMNNLFDINSTITF